MIRFALLLSLAVLTGCAPRAQIFVDKTMTGIDFVRPIFIGTTRESDAIKAFGNERSEDTSYMRFDFSVPPDREPGSISFPKDGEPNAAEDFIATNAALYASPADFSGGLRSALSQISPAQREAIIFVHGFNNTFAEGVLRMAQLSADFELKGVAVHYSWASGGNPLGYVYDRDSVLFARDGLEELIQQVEAAGARNIILIGHSMGSLLIMETLRQMAIARPGSVDDRVDGVILISPDIDIEVFRSQAKRIGDLPDPFGIFISQRDRALQLSARLTGQRSRLGNTSSIEELEDLDVTVLDVTEFSRGGGHFTAGTSPALLRLFASAGNLEDAFRGDSAGRTGLFSGTILTVQNATEVILSPTRILTGDL